MKRLYHILILLSFVQCSDNKSSLNSGKQTIGITEEYHDLKITANFREFGEWGGHSEVLLFKMKNGNVYCVYTRDSIENKSDLVDPNKKPLIVESKTVQLESKDFGVINHYLKTLRDSCLNNENIPNGNQNRFESKLDNGNFITYKYHNEDPNWDPFITLKNSIIKE